MDIYKYKLNRLNRYATFLYQNSFHELVAEDLRLNKEAKLPIFEKLKDDTEEELYTKAANLTRDYLKILMSEHPLASSFEYFAKWKENRLPDFPKEIVEAVDLFRSFKTRKLSFMHFIPSYTKNVSEAIEIAQELEDFYYYVEEEVFNYFLQQQQKRQDELHKAMEIAQIGSYTWDIKNDAIIFTPLVYKIFGFKENDVISLNTYMDFVHPDDKERFTKIISESIENHWPLDVEYRIIRKDNEERIIWGKGKTTYKDEEAVYMQGTIMDVTEKRLTELEVQYREAQLVEAQSIAGIGSFDWDFLNNRSSCTAELYRIFGWPADKELNFTTFEELAHPEDLEKVFISLHNAMENKAPYDCEYRIITPNKTLKWVWARGKVTFDGNGNAIRLTGTVLDITERKLAQEEINKKNEAIIAAYEKLEDAQNELKAINQQLEERVTERTRDLELSIQEQKKSAEQLRLKNEELEKINADLDNFIYTASHDLKAPITNIEGLLHMVMKMMDTNHPKFQTVTDMIHTSIRRFKETIKDLTEIAKVQKDTADDTEVLNLQETLNDALFDVQDLVTKNTANIKVNFKVPEIQFSKKNLRSIFYNLVSNALKYRSGERDPEVCISSEKKGKYTLITVSDNGLGIAENKIDKIFTMFKRLHSHVEGSGLGLYIVKRIIDNAGGKIEVESKEGEGTTFRLYI